MKIAEYKEEYDHAPIELTEFADGAKDVTDDADFAHAAREYLSAMRTFEKLLAEHDITVG